MRKLSDTHNMIIIGGGVGGLATALGLARKGKKVILVEQAPEFGEVGAGIQLAPNATKILDELGVLDDLLELAVLPKRLVLRDVFTAEELAVLDLGEKFVERYKYPYIVVHRADLHTVLLNACKQYPEQIELRTNVNVKKVTEGNPITIEAESGEILKADYLIGADGIRSNTRKVIKEDDPVNSGYVAYRGTLPTEELGDYVNYDDVIMWIGPNLHLVQYPVRSGKLFNQVVVFKSYDYQTNSDDWGTPEEMDRRFKNSHPLVQTAISYIERQFRWPMFDRDTLDQWVKNNIALVGDAAHPMLQYLAQGGCQALEDAIVLQDEIAKQDDIAQAFVNYESRRLKRGNMVQANARKWGEFLHLEDEIPLKMREVIFNKHHAQNYEVTDFLYKTD